MYSQYLVRLLCLLLALPTIHSKVTFIVINEAIGTSPPNMLGTSQISKRQAVVTMRTAYDFIKKEIYKQGEDPFIEKNIAEITLKIVEGKEPNFRQSKNEIRVSVDYFSAGDTKTLKKDFNRNIHRAMTLQFLSEDAIKIPDELSKGIADFIVLEAGLAPDNWAKPGEGKEWSERSDITAQFLHYCDMTSNGFVSILIKNIKIPENESKLDSYLVSWWEKYKEYYKQ